MLELENLVTTSKVKSETVQKQPAKNLFLKPRKRHGGKRHGNKKHGNRTWEFLTPQTEPISSEVLSKQADHLAAWCTNQALPLWASNGLRQGGGFHEFLSADGSPKHTPQLRVRVQARLAYVYALAAHMGWCSGVDGGTGDGDNDGNARAMSDRAWQFTLGVGSAVSGLGVANLDVSSAVSGGVQIATMSGGEPGYQGCAHLLNPDNTLVDDLRDAYAQSFVILAGAWRYRAFGDQPSLQIARDLCAHLRSHFLADNGGYFEDHRPHAAPQSSTTQPRRQNPHMHLFEAFMAMYDATQEPQYLDMAEEIFDLFQTVFYDGESQTLTEFFNKDWSRTNTDQHPNGGALEPGHMMEWCWLLGEYAARRGAKTIHAVRPLMVGLYGSAMFHGQSPSGLLYDFVWPKDSADANRPDISLTCRTWPQTERLKADLAMAKIARTAGEQNHWMQNAAQAADLLCRHYLERQSTISGGWVDQVDGHGLILNDDIPASTFYHIVCAGAELSQFCSSS